MNEEVCNEFIKELYFFDKIVVGMNDWYELLLYLVIVEWISPNNFNY